MGTYGHTHFGSPVTHQVSGTSRSRDSNGLLGFCLHHLALLSLVCWPHVTDSSLHVTGTDVHWHSLRSQRKKDWFLLESIYHILGCSDWLSLSHMPSLNKPQWPRDRVAWLASRRHVPSQLTGSDLLLTSITGTRWSQGLLPAKEGSGCWMSKTNRSCLYFSSLHGK